ncbi:hypothetical protein DXG03_009066 [Asterophora parasitica]|uniref:NACHT domain-containing protein n=1 Tax=Asterophora parasitica TaxID=117018 RepID=A0A9P7G7B3_9AGAR|nr:hypothetical protein DXG03_009066 [Asterophora parasitica]
MLFFTCLCNRCYLNSLVQVQAGSVITTLPPSAIAFAVHSAQSVSTPELPAPSSGLEALRARIIELEDEIAQQPPTKRAQTSHAPAADEASTSAAGPSAASLNAEEKKRKMQAKKILIGENDAFIYPDEVYSEAEFDSLFKGKGILMQPTPENKPKSVVTIIHLNTRGHIASFFGDELKVPTGNTWSRGGMPARTFGGGFFGGFGGSTFTKSIKLGAVDVAVQLLEVNYSKNNMKCSLKFQVGQTSGMGSHFDFFCSRESEGRSDSRLIFPTFAYHFARCDVELRNRIVCVLKDSLDIGHALPKDQLPKLLIDHLRDVYTGSQRPIVLIINALDECAGGRAPETILTVLASEIQSVPFLKVFVSSRPTASTNEAFSNEALRQHREIFVLHDVEEDIVDADIHDYMTERLSKKATLRRLSTSSWPPDEPIRKLTSMAGGLFIFASTVCEFIEARGDLKFLLKEITQRPINEYTGIDGLYREILEYAIAQFPDEITLAHCRTIIGTIITLQDPLSSYDLGHILRLPPKHIQGILGDLQAVLSVPDDIHGAIRTLHTSFPDFMSTKSRCLSAMYVEPTPHHYMITLRLLEIMRDGLRRNMAYFIRFKRNKADHFPGNLRYACRYWADHLCRIEVQNASGLIQALICFVSTKLAYCLEVLDSVSGPLEVLCESVIDKAASWVAVSGKGNFSRLELILDPKQISDAPQQLTRLLCDGRASLEVDLPEENLFSLFAIPSDTRCAQRGHGRMCSEGTRNKVLESILHWTNDKSATQLYWLNGAAGTGKTTIAMTIADLIAMDRSKLTATFFCSRYSRYRRHVRHLFVTLSIYLAAREPQFREQLVKAVSRNPRVVQALPKDQLRILIIEPLRLAGLLGKPIIFVIDALDECRPLEEDAPGKVLNAFSEHLHKIPSLKVLISTRPSPSLSRELNAASWTLPLTQFNLHDVNRFLVDEDICQYLLEILCANAGIIERLSPAWPPDDLLDKLVAKAGGFFLYASFIGQCFVLVGAQKLKQMVEHSESDSEYEGNLGLNLFYGRMLKHLLLDASPHVVAQVRSILGVLTHLYEPVSAEAFGELVPGVSEWDLQQRLRELQPIVIVSAETKLMRPLHDSVRHWLTDAQRALPTLLMDPVDVHQAILSHLIAYMTSGFACTTSRVSWLAKDANNFQVISSEPGVPLLDYACRYWVDHLVKTASTPDLELSVKVQKELEDFLETNLAVWIGRLDSMGDLIVAAMALENLRAWYHHNHRNLKLASHDSFA